MPPAKTLHRMVEGTAAAHLLSDMCRLSSVAFTRGSGYRILHVGSAFHCSEKDRELIMLIG